MRASQNYSSLNHWRGLAALGVVLFHGFGSIRAQQLPVHTWVQPLKCLADYGWLGVHLFFVISGYCIAVSVQRALQQNRGITEFLADRILRIYPTYWAACLLALATHAAASLQNPQVLAANLPASGRQWLANLLLIEPYLQVPTLLLVSWSLVYEVTFYLVAAAGMGLLRTGVPAVLIGGSACLLAIVGHFGPWNGPLYFTNYWGEFLAGVCVCGAVTATHSGLVCCLLLIPCLLATAVWPGWPGATPSGAMPVAAVFALLLFALHRWDRQIADYAPLRWLAWIGTFSYSLYLTHMFLGLRLVNLAGRWIGSDSLWQALLQPAACGLSVGLAWLFFRLVEQPMEAVRKRLRGGSRGGARGVVPV